MKNGYDVIVVGAGTAGAAAAAMLAERGMKVLCLDRRPLATAGARWVNGVALAAFDEAGIPRPSSEELSGPHGGHFHLIAGWGPRRCSTPDEAVVDLDMRALVARLHERARAAGAELRGGVRVDGREDVRRSSHAPTWTTLETSDGAVGARWIVDASGLGGCGLLDAPDIAPRDICAAAQANYEVTDRRAMDAFFAAHGAEVGDALCFTGVAGGYSIVRIASDGDEVGVLTGSVPAEGHPSGKQLLDAFVAEQSWIGARRFGGARAIPIRRPLDRLADGQVMLLGDAACQVFPAHGSGIGAGMVAARVLADALVSGRGPHGYAVAWQRRHGRLMASYDLFRRFSQRLAVDEVERLVTSGLMNEETLAAGLEQRLPEVGVRDVPTRLAALVRGGGLSARMLGVAARMAAVSGLYAAYPATPGRLRPWSRTVARIFGDPPDL